MNQKKIPGVFIAKKKNGEPYYRASITYKRKHISLGSYPNSDLAHKAYLEAHILIQTTSLTPEDYRPTDVLPFEKFISLLNFRDNNIYTKNPIYFKKGFFLYYLSIKEVYTFDIDDLFYYSEHKIIKRDGHLFVADYGMQVNILSRYGIKNYSVAGKDYLFMNSNPYDFRYSNIMVVNPYYGVEKITDRGKDVYKAKIHVNGNYIIGKYTTVEEAAIAYNKAIDVLKKAGSLKNYQLNFIESMTGKEYAEIYSRIKISSKLYKLTFD